MKQKKKNKRGGKRKGAGRKPMDRDFIKIPITVWLRKIDVEKEGGKKAVSILLHNKFYTTHRK